MLHLFEDESVSLYLSELSLLESSSSKHNQVIQLYRHSSLGKILVINNQIQHIEAWATLYHEMLVHIPIAFIKEVKRVLIIGGGSLFAAREALKYNSVQSVKMIDHDYKVIELMRKNYPHAEEVFSDSRFSLVVEDAFDAIEKSNDTFDLIVNDAVDLLNYNKQKGEKLLFELLSEKLTHTGVCSDVIYRHIFEKTTTINTVNLLSKKFHSAFSLIVVPEYPGILHLLSMWGNSSQVSQQLTETKNLIQRKWLKSQTKNLCEFYNPKFMSYYFYLPPYLKKLLT